MLAAPQVAVAVGAVAAVATVVRVASELVQAAVGKEIGLYRTSFLAFERFGVGRQPAEGLRQAQGIEFAYEVIDISGDRSVAARGGWCTVTDTSDPAAEVQERNVAPLPVEHRFAVRANRWAIIVGISEYEDARLNLTWANRDAQKLYELIQTPAGGGFEPERIELLIDGKATTAAVTRALRTFLKKPAREDVVLLYFACHGTPDIDRPNITYLLTHDTDPDDVSGTALPMREIDLSLQENLLAEKVVIIADTCHSASIGNAGGRRDAGNDAGAINAYLEKVSQAHGGVALLTSAESNETAREGKQWGDGHGVFTHFLLRGLQGEADGYGRPKDGVVSVGELFDYVRDNVKRATDDQQHPAIGTTPFDRNLPMAITGGVSAREHVELGRRLLELGRRLDERERYLAAASRFAEAIPLSKHGASARCPRLSLGLGHALLAAGDPPAATQALQPLIGRSTPGGRRGGSAAQRHRAREARRRPRRTGILRAVHRREPGARIRRLGRGAT